MSEADAGTMIEELRAAFPALVWKWRRYLEFAEGSLTDSANLISARIIVHQLSEGGYRAEVSRFSVSMVFDTENLPGLVLQMREHLLRVAHFYQTAARRYPQTGGEE